MKTTNPFTQNDRRFMGAALGLARRGLGNVAPNPAVGCVLVRPDLDGGITGGGRIVGRGWTQPGGRPHAETEALRRAGALANGATAYVTLEPCCHTGKTGPCTEALIAAGVTRVVVAVVDPFAKVAGQGIKDLRAAGLTVDTGLFEAKAAEVNAGFFKSVSENRPLVTLKVASSLDGRIAVANGDSKWLTGPQARERGHLMRAQADAILVGGGTVTADDPDLTCRLPGMTGRSPVRVVMASGLSAQSKLYKAAGDPPVWLMSGPKSDSQPPAKEGFSTFKVEGDANGRPDPAAVLAKLAEQGITRLLIEGGGTVAASFLKAGLIDRIAWFHAPVIVGGDGLPAIAGLSTARMADALRLERLSVEVIGEDVLEMLAVHPRPA